MTRDLQRDPQRDRKQRTRARGVGAPPRHYRVCVLSGTGLGPEMVAYSHTVLDALGELYGFAVAVDLAPFAAEALHRHGDHLPQATLERCRTADAVLVADSGQPLERLLEELAAGEAAGLHLGPGGHWLDEPDQARAHLFAAASPIVALIAVEGDEVAGFGQADPTPALAACCLLLEALGERAAATTLARAVHQEASQAGPESPSESRSWPQEGHRARGGSRYDQAWGAAKTPQERVERVISALEERRVDVEFPGVWEAVSA